MSTIAKSLTAIPLRAASPDTETTAQTIQKLREEAEKMATHSACARRGALTLNAVARAYWSKQAGKQPTVKGRV